MQKVEWRQGQGQRPSHPSQAVAQEAPLLGEDRPMGTQSRLLTSASGSSSRGPISSVFAGMFLNTSALVHTQHVRPQQVVQLLDLVFLGDVSKLLQEAPPRLLQRKNAMIAWRRPKPSVGSQDWGRRETNQPLPCQRVRRQASWLVSQEHRPCPWCPSSLHLSFGHPHTLQLSQPT